MLENNTYLLSFLFYRLVLSSLWNYLSGVFAVVSQEPREVPGTQEALVKMY